MFWLEINSLLIFSHIGNMYSILYFISFLLLSLFKFILFDCCLNIAILLDLFSIAFYLLIVNVFYSFFKLLSIYFKNYINSESTSCYKGKPYKFSFSFIFNWLKLRYKQFLLRFAILISISYLIYLFSSIIY